MSMLAESSLYDFVFIYYSRNQAYLRVRAILHMMNDPAQLIEHGLGPYVLEEYQHARKAVGSLSDEHPYVQAYENPDPFLTFFARVGSDLPMLYGTYLVLTEPSSISVAQFSIMQRSASVLSSSITEIISSASTFRDRCHSIKELYRAEISVGVMKDGAVAYPDPIHEEMGGMAIEVRNLHFSYPEAATTTPTLHDINFSIKPGQLVVIVGANGSGKSTILKLLTRVYDPDAASGPDSILVDERPISEYRLGDLRRATSMLNQDHELYPLSLRENIGLGYVEKHNDLALIQRAIELGGASHCIEKLKDGMETKMDEESYSDKWDLPAEEEHPLNVELAGLPTAPTLSGGEKQRIVASRTFMRFMSGKTRLVAVDEPTSAFDAAGEQALFDNLLSMREGKTMIVVTHRFGTLTRQADFIICMKDGTIKERGSHNELMKLDGEYANLYNIQARAFVDDEKKER
ncbi:P-loop containing nucleoside triphosphate hydrolase protein [Cylindrobasidium torrendii FP15055 ss-10]|uniref:p-loop containing nucleoside triphosphate hydrolase protein n=1 Tax=Cylindrobasidium torrendii FP15055 ss-10 TaxID=1314674 RepID=A0A0D7BST8_9AGAR|nr:P-loop containing nucleoside triphosphate hydrolase protein [Cylindrobasidium torrendii FP15055 ss-10]